MLFRLVRPVKRPDSSIPQFIQRIPTDILPLVAGRTLSLPLGTETVLVRVTPKMRSIRFSLRTRDPAEVKARQGQAASALERHWTALRNGAPMSLNHRQATALAGDLYRVWADAGADRIAMDCPWRDGPRGRAKSQYVPKCKAHFVDLERPGRPPDLPPGVMRLRVVQGGKG